VTDGFAPAANFFYVALLASITKPRQVLRDGAVLPDLGSDAASLTNSPVDAWYWNESIQIAFVKAIDNKPDTTVTVHY